MRPGNNLCVYNRYKQRKLQVAWLVEALQVEGVKRVICRIFLSMKNSKMY